MTNFVCRRQQAPGSSFPYGHGCKGKLSKVDKRVRNSSTVTSWRILVAVHDAGPWLLDSVVGPRESVAARPTTATLVIIHCSCKAPLYAVIITCWLYYQPIVGRLLHADSDITSP